MFALKNRKGFTLIELIIVVAIISIFAVWLVLVPFVLKANSWYTPAGVLKDLRVDHPEVREILRTETHFTDLTIVVVENQDKSRSTYTLDSDILLNYDLKKVEKSGSLEKATLKNE